MCLICFTDYEDEGLKSLYSRCSSLWTPSGRLSDKNLNERNEEEQEEKTIKVQREEEEEQERMKKQQQQEDEEVMKKKIQLQQEEEEEESLKDLKVLIQTGLTQRKHEMRT